MAMAAYQARSERIREHTLHRRELTARNGLFDQERLILKRAIRDLEFQLDTARADREKLLALAMQMREEGATARPEHLDERWEGGKYVMGDDPEKAAEVSELEREARAAITDQL